MAFSFLRKPSDSSITLNGRHSNRARSRPSMPPRVYRVRRIRSLRKPSVRPVCCRFSGALGASGRPPPSQSSVLEVLHRCAFSSRCVEARSSVGSFSFGTNGERTGNGAMTEDSGQVKNRHAGSPAGRGCDKRRLPPPRSDSFGLIENGQRKADDDDAERDDVAAASRRWRSSRARTSTSSAVATTRRAGETVRRKEGRHGADLCRDAGRARAGVGPCSRCRR